MQYGNHSMKMSSFWSNVPNKCTSKVVCGFTGHRKRSTWSRISFSRTSETIFKFASTQRRQYHLPCRNHPQNSCPVPLSRARPPFPTSPLPHQQRNNHLLRVNDQHSYRHNTNYSRHINKQPFSVNSNDRLHQQIRSIKFNKYLHHHQASRVR